MAQPTRIGALMPKATPSGASRNAVSASVDMQPLLQDSGVRRRVNELSWKYPSAQSLMERFHVTRQTEMTANEEHVFIGYPQNDGTRKKEPLLMDVSLAYGKGTTKEFLACQFANLSEYSGARDKMTVEQLRELCDTVANDNRFRLLSLVEVMLFCQWFKAGRYGKFYGSVDPNAITKSLNQFWKERQDKQNQYYDIARARKAEEYRLNLHPCSYEEYLAQKQTETIKAAIK